MTFQKSRDCHWFARAKETQIKVAEAQRDNVEIHFENETDLPRLVDIPRVQEMS